MKDKNKVCEVCNKKKGNVRFEGLTESFICDGCLYLFKERRRLKELDFDVIIENIKQNERGLKT